MIDWVQKNLHLSPTVKLHEVIDFGYVDPDIPTGETA